MTIRIDISTPSFQEAEALIDAEDFPRACIFNWIYRRDGYAVAVYKRQTILLHRYVMRAEKGQIVDHINGDRLDCRKANLRITDYHGNSRNAKPHGESQYRGVARDRKKWKARIYANGRREHLGVFDSEEEAARAYDKRAMELFGEYARLNFSECAAD